MAGNGAVLPSTMDALALTAPNEFEIQERPVPAPAPYEVLLEIHSVAICGTDTEIIGGHMLKKGWPPSYPYTPGHEWSGTVVETGEYSAGLGYDVGTRVAGTAHCGCGYCRMCETGRYNLCLNYGREDLGHRHYGHYSTGAFRQYHNVSVKSIYPIPESMTLEQAALVDAASIALHAVKRARVEPGDVAAIIGPGAQGLLAAQAARILGAARVIVVGRAGERLTKAADMGFEVVDNREANGPDQVRDITGGLGASFTVDTAARGTTPADAVDMTRKGGRVSLIGIPAEPVVLPLNRIVLEEMDFMGVRANPGTCEEVIPLIASGQLDVDTVTTHRFPLLDFGKGFETFTKRIDGAIKVLIQPN